MIRSLPEPTFLLEFVGPIPKSFSGRRLQFVRWAGAIVIEARLRYVRGLLRVGCNFRGVKVLFLLHLAAG